jgi:hypothetical protein
MARVLKPGGRVAISDIALKRQLPPEVSRDVMAYVGCIAGAILIEDYRQGLIDAGFSEVMVVDSKADLNAYAKIENQQGCCSPVKAEDSALGAAAGQAAGSYSCCAPVTTTQLESSCCASAPDAETESELQDNLRDLLSRYNVNDYAASVKVFAVKPLSA